MPPIAPTHAPPTLAAPRSPRSLGPKARRWAPALAVVVFALAGEASAAPRGHAREDSTHGVAPSPKVIDARSRHGETAALAPHVSGGRPREAQTRSPKAKPHASTRKPAKHPSTTHRKCLHAAVEIERAELHEASTIALTDCDGRPRREAQQALSSLARLRGTPRPKDTSFDEITTDGESVDRGVALMHHGLVERLQRIADHFPDKTIGIVSGYRPQSNGSLHQHARAIDIHLTGVDNVALVELCRTLPDTGCGYYPNSSFVHVDVRPPGSGKVTWIDASGPGEKPHYVRSWPPSKSLELAPSASDGDDPYADDAPEHGGSERD